MLPKLQNQVLLSRLLTRSGDQAWDFALPVTLVLLFPQQLGLIAALFLANKIGQFLFQPALTGVVDRWRRSHTAYLGTALQLVSVLGAAACLFSLSTKSIAASPNALSFQDWTLIAGITAASVTSALGSGLMEIAVGSDWIPTLVRAEELAQVNSRMKQIDLATEVLSPVLAGLLLGMSSPAKPLWGFSLVVLWNAVSFVPEIFLLRSVFKRSQALQALPSGLSERTTSLLEKTRKGWNNFWQHSASLVMIAYAFLWLSALSPHGVLLTSFLKGGWQLSEFELGIFRGAGAVFGLLATLCFPPVVRRFGVVKGSLVFISLQAVAVLTALPFFYFRTLDGFIFLTLILFSRIGLYGFSMGEMEIRQRSIAPGQRGEINGVATALTSFATLIHYGAGTLVGEQAQFVWMVALSVVAVCCGAATYYLWYKRIGRSHL